jgi:hypothetical protein
MNKQSISPKTGLMPTEPAEPAGAKQLPEPLVDFHVHLFPDRLFDAIWRQFVTDYGWSILHPLYWRESVAYLRDRGVGPIVYSNYAHRKDIARGLNDWNLKILGELPDIYCFAAFIPTTKTALRWPPISSTIHGSSDLNSSFSYNVFLPMMKDSFLSMSWSQQRESVSFFTQALDRWETSLWV